MGPWPRIQVVIAFFEIAVIPPRFSLTRSTSSFLLPRLTGRFRTMLRDVQWQTGGQCLALLASFAFSVGCGSGVQQLDKNDPSRIRMQSLAILYASYLNHNGGKLPASETELKNFMLATGKTYLAERGINKIDDLFVSQRDGQPLVVSYGAHKLVRGFTADPIVAHEKAGLNGMRLVAFPSGAVLELDTEMFSKLPIAKDAGGMPAQEPAATAKP
jgi:hypothetical protein